MLDFPPLFNTSIESLIPVIMGSFCLFSGPYLLVKFIQFLIAGRVEAPEPGKHDSKEPRGWKCLLFGLSSTAFGVLMIIIYLGGMIRCAEFRSIKLESIRALEIRALTGPYRSDPGPVKTMNDSAIIGEGLEELLTAISRSRNNEEYSDGYIIHLVGAQSNGKGREYYIAVYRKSSRTGSAAIVIPAIGTPANWGISGAEGLGEYSCPPFLEWVDRHVDPLFRE